MTLDIYAHATERKAPTTIRRVLFGSVGGQTVLLENASDLGVRSKPLCVLF
jgi:hypothetical protein